MLLALWPAILSHSQWHSAGHEGLTATQRAIHSKDVAKRRLTLVAAQRLQEAERGTGFEGNTGGEVALAGVSDSYQPVGNATIRIPRHERTLAGRLPSALGASIAAGDAIPHELNAAMKRYAAKQAADDDDEMAMIIILAGMA